MKAKMIARLFVVVAFLAAAVLLCVSSVMKAVKDPVPGGMAATNDAVKVDFDFTSMNDTMRMTYTYRLAAKPREFEGKTLRISGTFPIGCLMGDPGGCACCAPGGVLEFMPKDSYVWPTNFPSVESRITLTGRLRMFEVGTPEQSFTIPRLVDADMSWALR